MEYRDGNVFFEKNTCELREGDPPELNPVKYDIEALQVEVLREKGEESGEERTNTEEASMYRGYVRPG